MSIIRTEVKKQGIKKNITHLSIDMKRIDDTLSDSEQVFAAI